MHEQSISLLNKAVAKELTAVHQYMYFHFHCDDLGYDLLATLFKRTAIEEMVHVERLAERILFLGGDVEIKQSEDVKTEQDVSKMLDLARKIEESTTKAYNDWANECAKNSDSASKQLFESLVTNEEAHFDQFDLEFDNMKKFGDNYLALQSIERSRSTASSSAGD